MDLISDDILDKKRSHKIASVLRDLWSVNLGAKELTKLFKCWLVALNKGHPRILTYDRFRPIVVSSPILKVLEARFIPKLESYTIDKLNTSQTGFVSYCGIFVNIVRTVDRIQKKLHV